MMVDNFNGIINIWGKLSLFTLVAFCIVLFYLDILRNIKVIALKRGERVSSASDHDHPYFYVLSKFSLKHLFSYFSIYKWTEWWLGKALSEDPLSIFIDRDLNWSVILIFGY